MMVAGGRSIEGNRSRSGKKAPPKHLRAAGGGKKSASATRKAKPKSKTRSAKRK
jgi:hypothetical protein